MFWNKRIFAYADGVGIDVVNVEAARQWYAEKLGLSFSTTDIAEDEGTMALGYSKEDILLALVRVPDRNTKSPSARPGHPPMLFVYKLDRAHEYLASHGVDVGPIQSDSGGNRFFRFRDLEGNELEVCKEP